MTIERFLIEAGGHAAHQRQRFVIARALARARKAFQDAAQMTPPRATTASQPTNSNKKDNTMTLWTWLRDGWRCQQYGITRAQLADLRAHYTHTRDTQHTATADRHVDQRLPVVLRCDGSSWYLLGRKTMEGAVDALAWRLGLALALLGIERQFGVVADDWRELWVLWNAIAESSIAKSKARRCPEKMA